MNERILELAKQCGYWSGQTIEMNDVGIKKFAELIVRECALTAGLMEHQGRKGIGAQILDNFGIKDEKVQILNKLDGSNINRLV